MLWTFGGCGPSIVNYLHKKGNGYGDHGPLFPLFHIFYNYIDYSNNQLLCFDPSIKE